MKKTILTLLFPLICSLTFGQNKEEAEKLVNEGIAYHDKGDYEGAILRYNSALAIDKDNLLALSEKAYSLLTLEKFDEAIICCQKAIETHPDDEGMSFIYVTYGNATDGLNKTDKSIEIYDEGIKKYPDFFLLYFNKGISLSSVKKYDDAIICFQKATMLNPKHASSHNAIARLSNFNNHRIPSILAYCRFLSIEPQTKRAKENMESLQQLLKANVSETGKNTISINFPSNSSSNLPYDSISIEKPTENNFTSTDLFLSMVTALDFDKQYKNETDVERFKRKMETVCSSLKETKENNYGYFWDYYVPYFIEMKDKNLLETFSYIAFASSDNEDVAKWLKKHKQETDSFFEWSKSFNWKIE